MQQKITENIQAIQAIYTLLLVINILAPLAIDWGYGFTSGMAILIFNPTSYIYLTVIILLFTARRSTFLAFLFLAPLFISIFYVILSFFGLAMIVTNQIETTQLTLFLILQILTLIFTGIHMNHDPAKISNYEK